MKIGLCPSSKKAPAKNFVHPIVEYLHKHNIEVYIDDELKNSYPLPVIADDSRIDLFITLGGDGTLLYFADKYSHHTNAFFTAINFGSLGFMADILIEDYQSYLDQIINGKWESSERIMLKISCPDGKEYFGINDVVFHRGCIKSMVKLEITINDQYFNTFQSDGLIIATPTGSTAYSLAANGPIMDPKLDAFAITPICPHALTTRPFITQDSSIINVKSISQKDTITVTIDGIHTFLLDKDQTTTIELAEKTFKLIAFPEKRKSFYSTLREKLNWKGFNSR